MTTNTTAEQQAIIEEILPLCDHPTDNPDLPSYEDTVYQWVKPRLAEASEHWLGDEAWKLYGKVFDLDAVRRHLPQEEAEDDEAYTARVMRSPWTSLLKLAINGFAGVLGGLVIGESVPDEIDALLSDVDLLGSNAEVFFRDCDKTAFLDGAVGVLVEHTEDGSPNPRPYLCMVDRRDIIKARGEFVDGKIAYTFVVIRETASEAVGLFGERIITRYRVYRVASDFGGSCVSELYEIVKSNDDVYARLVGDPAVMTTKGVPLTHVPFVMYSLTASPKEVVKAPTPFKELMRLQDLLYQLWSSYISVIIKCNIPVPVRIGLLHEGVGDGTTLPPIIVGTGYGIDLPKSGDAKYLEPSGNAIAGTRQAIQDALQDAMRFTLDFLGCHSTNSATEADLRSTQAKSNLNFAAIQKESAIQEILDHVAMYLGVESTDPEGRGGLITVSRDLLKQVLDANYITALSSLVDRGQLSLATFLTLLADGRVLPHDLDVDDEVMAISAQNEAKVARAVDAVARQAKATMVYADGDEGEEEGD